MAILAVSRRADRSVQATALRPGWVSPNSEEQRQTALDTIADADASGLWPGPVVTEVVAAGQFWEAEQDDQDYLQKHPDGETCHSARPDWKLPRRQQVSG